MTVKPNIYLCNNSSMIWATDAMGDKNDQQIYSTQLDSYYIMVVVRNQECIIKHFGGISDVRTFSNECSNMEQVPIVDDTLVYDFQH